MSFLFKPQTFGKVASCLSKYIGTTITSQTRKMTLPQSAHLKVYANNIDFSYVKVGNGNQVVLLLPGALGSATSDFLPQLESFDRDNFTVIALDPRGYGTTRPPQRDFPVDFYVRDALDAVRVMEALDSPKYSVLGWSDGGNCACIMASWHPARINKLLVWGSNSFVTPKEHEAYKSIRDIILWSPRMRDPMIQEYGRKQFEAMWHGWVDSFGEMEKDAEGIIDIYRKDLKRIETDTMIIHGMKDRLVPLFQSEYLRDNIANSKLVIWDDGAHNLHLRFHERFKKIAEEFLLDHTTMPSHL